MISGRAPPYGLLSIHVQRDGTVHLRYGKGYDALDPKHQDNAWLSYLKIYIEREAKRFINHHKEVEQ